MKKEKNILDDLLADQSSLMIALGIDPTSSALGKGEGVSKSDLGAVVGIILEGAEILELVEKGHRKWKPDGDAESLLVSVKEEMIDVLFFVLELSVLLGLTGDDLVTLYRGKLRKNIARLYEAVMKGHTEITDEIRDLLYVHFSVGEVTEMTNKLRQENGEEK